MVKERIVEVEMGADLLRDAVVREPLAFGPVEYASAQEAYDHCPPWAVLFLMPDGRGFVLPRGWRDSS